MKGGLVALISFGLQDMMLPYDKNSIHVDIHGHTVKYIKNMFKNKFKNKSKYLRRKLKECRKKLTNAR